MHRIAAAILIVGAVLAMNGGLLREAFAEEFRPTTASRAVVVPVQTKSAKLLSLLVVLESLRQEQVRLDGQKV